MMTPDQRRIVVEVYTHLLESEKRGWDSLDDYILYLDYLNDDQLQREAGVIFTRHDGNKVKCQENHSRERCFVPVLIDAVSAIIELYKETGNLHEKNRYILNYYLAMDHAGMIIVDGD